MFTWGLKMLSTRESRGPQLQETAEVALDNVLATIEKAIKERTELDEIFNSLNTPKMVNANSVATLATSEANKEVDQQAGGVGNAIFNGLRSHVQADITRKAHSLVGPSKQTPEIPETGNDPLAPLNFAEPTTYEGPARQERPAPALSQEQRPGESSTLLPELKSSEYHLAALLAAIRPAPAAEAKPEIKSYSLTGLAA